MAIQELEKKTEEARKERQKNYHMVEIKNNREDIRIICERTIDLAEEYYSKEMDRIPEWSIVSITVISFVKQAVAFLVDRATKEMNKVTIDIGDFITFGIEYGVTLEADGKDATFNPLTIVGKEMYFDNENMDNNKLPKDAPNIELTSDIETICQGALNTLKSMYGIIIGDWRYVIYIFVSFMRNVKQYLIQHKDQNDSWGCVINFAEVLDFTIEKCGEEDEPAFYVINFGPGKDFKITQKDDDKSENHNQ